MPETLLRTKLFIPPVRPNLVPRPQLIARLNEGVQLGHKLTLISAAAGSGKTTLLSDWAAASGRPVAWLALDEEDGDTVRFLTYFIAALQAIVPETGQSVLAMLQTPQPPPAEAILTVLLNEIITIPEEFILVLDDYHLVDAAAVDEALTFLLEHLPPEMHLVIASREDPNLRLARYRARGQMTEIRAADLRFTAAEASGLLNQVMELGLTTEEVMALEARTEGWIAGLQMAALSMQGRADTAEFIAAFTGSHRFVLDYLVEEVLQQQGEDVRRFLLQTAILDRLCGPLCDAVSGRADGKEMLAFLERGNLFVVPLDDKREWYRYHHLFADVVATHLLAEQARQVPILHKRASDWYEAHGLRAEAIHHALAAQDLERAAGLIELAWPAMDGSFQSNTWLRWAKALPHELVSQRPVLNVANAWAELNLGELEAAEARLQESEQLLAGTIEKHGREQRPAESMVVVDGDQFGALPASIASARAYIAQARGDVPGTATFAQRALEILPENDYVRRGPAAALLGLAYWGQGELDAAYQALDEAMTGFRMADSISFAISGTYGLADIRIAQGRLREAMRIYERALQLAREQGEPVIRGTADLYLGLSMLQRERGNGEAAARNMARSVELGERAALGDWPYRVRVAQARAKEDEGDLRGALELLDEAERYYVRTPVPNLQPTSALKTEIWVKQGRLPEAWAWVREQELSAADDLSYLQEFAHLTLAKVLMAQYADDQSGESLHEAVRLLERLQQAAEAGGRMGSVIAILVVQAVAHQAQGDRSAALLALERALTLAEAEGYVRVFVDEGPALTTLLQEAAKKGIMINYVRRLLAAFAQVEGMEVAAQPLAEALSERELDVLQLLGTELSGPEIARELIISLSTVRTHTRNIYSKLGVNNRRAAVRRAGELNLL